MTKLRIPVDSTECSQDELTTNCASKSFLDELHQDTPIGKSDKQPADTAPPQGQEQVKAEGNPEQKNEPAAAEPQQKPGEVERPAGGAGDKKPEQDKPVPAGGGIEPVKPPVQEAPKAGGGKEVKPAGGGTEPGRAPEDRKAPDEPRKAIEVQPPAVQVGEVGGRILPARKAVEHPLLPPFEHPELKTATDDEVYKIANIKIQGDVHFKWAKGARIEQIRRVENTLNADEVKEAKQSIPVVLKALKEGKRIELDKNNVPFIGDQPLSLDERFNLHNAVVSDLTMMARKSLVKMDTAAFLYANHQYKDAQDYALWAKESADEIPIDLLREEAKQLQTDIALYADPVVRADMLKAAATLATDGKSPAADMLPIQSRKMLTMLYMGTEFKLENGQVVAEFGKTTGFKPDLAFDMAKETREKTKEILGFDPLDEKQARKDPEVASLFGGILEMTNNPEKYNMYKLVDEYKLERMKKELKSLTGTDSMLTDIGVVGFTAGVLALSRNPKIQAGLENMLGRVLPGAEKSAATLSKVAGFTTAALGAPLVRHYGYKTISGLDESWADTGVHVAGSLAAAELGGRVLGQGSMLTGRAGRGVAALQNFDKVGSAEWLSLQGYNTTGKLADLLKSAGYTTEATIFANAPRGTKLTSEVGIKAIEQANLTNSRLATVAKSVSQDLRAASGFDSSKIADSLSKSTNGKVATVDDVAKLIEQDRQVLEQYLKVADTSKKGALVSDSLGQQGWTQDGLRLSDAVEKLGVKNVGDAEKLLGQLKKGMADQFPRVAEMQAAGLANGTTKLTDLAASANRVFDGPGLDRLLSRVPVPDRASLLTDKVIDEVMAHGGGKRTKIQEAVLAQSTPYSLSGVPSYFGVATPSSVARTNWTTSLMAGGTIAGTYNSIVKTWDLMQTDNPATGQPYSLPEAFREAHFPTILDGNAPPALRYATSFLVGTPGQTVAAALMLRPGAIHQGGKSALAPKPWAQRTWNSLNANYLSTPGLSGAGALGATLWHPMIEDSARNGMNTSKYKELLKNSQAPIENKPLPFNR